MNNESITPEMRQQLDAIHAVRMRCNNASFLQHIFATIHVNSNDDAIKMLMLDAYELCSDCDLDITDIGNK